MNEYQVYYVQEMSSPDLFRNHKRCDDIETSHNYDICSSNFSNGNLLEKGMYLVTCFNSFDFYYAHKTLFYIKNYIDYNTCSKEFQIPTLHNIRKYIDI